MGMKLAQITIMFEVPEDYTGKELHEDLCLALHLHDIRALDKLTDNIIDINLEE